MAEESIDQLGADKFAGKLFGDLGGAMNVAMIWLGDHLGLYRALQQLGRVTSTDLADHLRLSERWVREWLHGQVASGYLAYRGDGCFEMTPAAAAVLADEDSPIFCAGGLTHMPALMGDVLRRLPEAFRSGLGLTFDDLGPDAARGIERLFAPWFKHALVPVAIPALDGMKTRLDAGARVADVGCGAGIALVELAKAFPESEFHGYDISHEALARARDNKAQAGLGNLDFHDASVDGLPDDASFDLVMSFDCIHDMAYPSVVIRAIRQSLKPDGTWFIADIHCGETLEENLALDNPMIPMMYGFSVLCCLSSSLSTPDGEGLGTVGFGESVARRMTADAGFSRFRRLALDHPMNAYYEVRP